MKTTLILIASSFMVLVMASAFMPGTKGASSASQGPKGIPDSVYSIISNSCTDCHADGGNGMAKSKVNFDKWDSYAPEKQASKAAKICEEIKKGAMPPSGFRKNNPDRIPSEKEAAMICNWAAGLEKK